MSNRSVFGGPALPFLILVFGLLGILVDALFFIIFVLLLGYYLYRIEKRLNGLEGQSGLRAQPGK